MQNTSGLNKGELHESVINISVAQNTKIQNANTKYKWPEQKQNTSGLNKNKKQVAWTNVSCIGAC